ncbi:MDR family MFS transporter [Streptomyces sp. NBRC 109706]|uniref:MDR family MFS transporter n=1 Tax=Streptomyces sp. NBRC 109706 TaxID=1550035 RepID=UPI0007830950|nr:MDR family MFS transporter [Streptomyces sp. NBRC 109706]
MLGIVLATLDGQIISTALPTVVGDLGGLNHFSWVVTVYLLAMSASTPIWGKLGDLYGRKGAYMSSVVVFLIGSILCGMAQDMTQLIVFRALQGLGAGGLMVGALSVIGVLVAPTERGRVQSIVAMMLPVAFVGGPLLGGFITDYMSWRWTFYVNVPVGAIALLAVARGVNLRTERTRGRIDYLGALLLTVAIMALTLMATWAGGRYSWLSPQIIGLGAVSVLSLAWFVRVERRADEPVTPPRLFRSREFTLAQILSFLTGAVMIAIISYLPQYMQFVQGASSTVSGMLILPMMLGMLVAQLTAGRLMDRGGLERVLPVTGSAVMIVGALVLLMLGTDTPVGLASASTLVMGAGVGILMQSTLLTTMNHADKKDMGAASGTVTLTRTIGGSLGVAVLGAVQASRMSETLARRLGPDAEQRLTGGGEFTPDLLKGMPPAVREGVQAAITSGLRGVVIGAGLLSLVAFVTTWFIRSASSSEPSPTDAPGPGPGPGGKDEAGDARTDHGQNQAAVRTPPSD